MEMEFDAWVFYAADIIAILFFVAVIFCIFSMGFSFIIKAFRQNSFLKDNKILLEQQNDLLRQIDNTLTGIDCRLIEIQENNPTGNEKE